MTIPAIDYRLCNIVSGKIEVLLWARLDIVDGTYFSSFDDVWKTEPLSFDDDAYVNLFNRSNMSMPNEVGKGYKNTAVGAIKSIYVVIEGAARSQPSSNATSQTDNQEDRLDILDIFGSISSPDATFSKMCYWVLCPKEDMERIPIVENAANTDANPERQDHVNPTSNNQTDTTELAQWNILQKCIHGFGEILSRKRKIDSPSNDDSAQQKQGNRKDGVGIKHFFTNRILLENQKQCFDDLYCLFIIPIMTIEQVKNWNGSSYSAIVLAWNGRRVSASTVYQKIGATRGKIDFANENKCNTACSLLKSMILCTWKSAMDKFSETFLTNNEMLRRLYKTKIQS